MRMTDALYGARGLLYTLMNAVEGRLAGVELAELQTSAAPSRRRSSPTPISRTIRSSRRSIA